MSTNSKRREDCLAVTGYRKGDYNRGTIGPSRWSWIPYLSPVANPVTQTKSGSSRNSCALIAISLAIWPGTASNLGRGTVGTSLASNLMPLGRDN